MKTGAGAGGNPSGGSVVVGTQKKGRKKIVMEEGTGWSVSWGGRYKEGRVSGRLTEGVPENANADRD